MYSKRSVSVRVCVSVCERASVRVCVRVCVCVCVCVTGLQDLVGVQQVPALPRHAEALQPRPFPRPSSSSEL